MSYPTWFAVVIVAVLCGCSTAAKSPVVLESVGPRPLSSYRGPPHGFLKVYSATDAHNDGDVVYCPRTAYSIYSKDGRLVKKVRNAISGTDEEPDLVTLPEGFYVVEAEAEHQASVKVPVIIEGGRLTSVHLDGDWKGKDVADNGFKTPSRNEQAELRMSKAVQEKIQVQNALSLEIQKLVMDFQEFLKVSPLADLQVEEATRALKLAKDRYLAKSGLISELDQAQKAYLRARENDLQVRFKAILNDVLLKQAVGNPN